MKYIYKVYYVAYNTLRIICNITITLVMPCIKEKQIGNYVIKRCEKKHIPQIISLYKKFNKQKRTPILLTCIMTFMNNKLVYIITNKDGLLMGFQILYFNFYDIRNLSIHEGFIAVAEEFRGLGLSRKLRENTLKDLSRIRWLRTVTSRISISNTRSMTGAINLGFREKRRYFEKKTNEERAFMVCDLYMYRR